MTWVIIRSSSSSANVAAASVRTFVEEAGVKGRAASRSHTTSPVVVSMTCPPKVAKAGSLPNSLSLPFNAIKSTSPGSATCKGVTGASCE